MPVLLLCYGDTAAKQLLRNAIEARYGRNAPAIESLQLEFEGRARVKLGFVKTWLPVVVKAWFKFPMQLRWDFIVKPLGLSVQRGIDAYDGQVYRSVRGNQPPAEIIEADLLETARRRLWAFAAILLTPLSDDYIRLMYHANELFEAENTRLRDTVMLGLRPNYALEYASVNCTNPDTQRKETFKLRLSESLCAVNGLMLPEHITAMWDNDIAYEMKPVKAIVNPDLADEVFSLTAATTD